MLSHSTNGGWNIQSSLQIHVHSTWCMKSIHFLQWRQPRLGIVNQNWLFERIKRRSNKIYHRYPLTYIMRVLQTNCNLLRGHWWRYNDRFCASFMFDKAELYLVPHFIARNLIIQDWSLLAYMSLSSHIDFVRAYEYELCLSGVFYKHTGHMRTKKEVLIPWIRTVCRVVLLLDFILLPVYLILCDVPKL